MRAQATWFNANTNISSIIVSQNIPPLYSSFFKKAGTAGEADVYAFNTGQLLARAANSDVVPFTATTTDNGDTWTYATPLAGVCEFSVSADAGDVRVITRAYLNADLIDFAGVSQTSGVAYTIADFLDYIKASGGSANLCDEFLWQGRAVLELLGINGQATVEYTQPWSANQ